MLGTECELLKAQKARPCLPPLTFLIAIMGIPSSLRQESDQALSSSGEKKKPKTRPQNPTNP